MIIVTGAAGFIGSNIVKAINERGEDTILAVDDLTDGRKFVNLADRAIADYMHHEDFRARIRAGEDFGLVSVVFHQGACSDTTEWNGKYMMDTNFEMSKEVFNWCQARKIPMVYASSAAVYGGTADFREDGTGELPLNVYGWSKLLFDQWLRRRAGRLTAPVIGLRYFNVFGRRQDPAGAYAAVIPKWIAAAGEGRSVEIFGDGETSRDFCYVDNAVQANILAATARVPDAINQIYNVAVGDRTTLNQLFAYIREALRSYHPGVEEITALHREPRKGDVRHSLADIGKARSLLGYEPTHTLRDGLHQVAAWYAAQTRAR